MSDIDGDSTMHSSPSDIDETEDLFPDEPTSAHAPTTPTHAPPFAPPSEISPPSSQTGLSAAHNNPLANTTRGDALTNLTGSPSAGDLNANGKRAIVEGRSAAGDIAMGSGASTTATAGAKQLGERHGYQWSKPEDEPGYAWGNRKAQEEAIRALDQIIDKEHMIGNRYGDPCEKRS